MRLGSPLRASLMKVGLLLGALVVLEIGSRFTVGSLVWSILCRPAFVPEDCQGALRTLHSVLSKGTWATGESGRPGVLAQHRIYVASNHGDACELVLIPMRRMSFGGDARWFLVSKTDPVVLRGEALRGLRRAWFTGHL